jgi:hypothetical protein
MAKNKAKINSNMEIVLQLLEENEISSEMGEAFASYVLNPTVVWAKFILTDDRKNANGQRIPKEEFSNLMRSGIHMPIKMAIGEIADGHDDSKPLGVITHLKEILTEEGTNALVALAALWGEERPADVKYIRESFNSGTPVNVSWEILYSEASFNNDTGSMDLHDTVLRAATVVGTPAYEGRTQFLSVAAKKWSPAYIEELPDSSFLYIDGNGKRYFPIADKEGLVDRTKLTDTIAALKESNFSEKVIEDKTRVLTDLIKNFDANLSVAEISRNFVGGKIIVEEVKLNTTTIEELQAEVIRLNAKVEEAAAALATKDVEIARLSGLTTGLEAELAPLKEFKASVDEQNDKVAKLAQVKEKFVAAGIDKPEEFYAENAEKLAALDEGALDFMVQELKAFAENSDTVSVASKKVTKIPALVSDSEVPTQQELVDYLKTRNAKK